MRRETVAALVRYRAWTVTVAPETPQAPAASVAAIATPKRPRADAGEAAFLGWAALAAVNQVLVAVGAPPGSVTARVLHHAYDAGQLLMLGLVSAAAVALVQPRVARLRTPRQRLLASALGTALVGFLVALGIVRQDVANAAARYGIPTWVAVVSASFACGAGLGATVLLRIRSVGWQRGLMVLAGIAGALLNTRLLAGDYLAFHFMLAWFSALLIGHGVEGAVPSLVPRFRRVALGMGLALCSMALAVPPPLAVLGRLLGNSSAVLAPFVARLYPESAGPDLSLIPQHVLRSPWFQDRAGAPSVPPSGALALPEPRIVLLLTVDALRADVLSKEEHLQKLPAFAELRRRSASFELARTAASSTRPSIASLFTGRYYPQLEWTSVERKSVLADSAPRLAELLARASVHTVSFPRLRRISSESGVGRGFAQERRKLLKAGDLVDAVIRELEAAKGRTFIYGHFGEPHAPYEGRGSAFERYVQEVQRVDRHIPRLLDFLETSGLAKRTLLILTADHGEGFDEHGMRNHALIIYEEVARIPLIIHGPGVVARAIEEPVTLVDLAPTILDVFGVPAPGIYMGRTLAPLLAGRDVKLERPIALHANRGREALYLPDSKKVILDSQAHGVEVYDLVSDPQERVSLVDERRDDVRAAIETARLFFHVHQAQSATEDETDVD